LLQPIRRPCATSITGAWVDRAGLEGAEPFAFNGKFTQLRYVNPWPVPISRPPVWIPGEVGRDLGMVHQERFLYAYLTYFGYMAGISVIDGYWETVERMGAGSIRTVARFCVRWRGGERCRE
jgi:alkanesulfonate monooxygenase SsuD/methylene tetrahydromethanopterin reductase-like flavin-dependent oxidoreductase (luciferase family)